MQILAFDTTTPVCAAALWRDGAVVSARSVAMDRGHAEALVPMLDEIMAEAGLAYAALDAVACTAGPGAFTGIRIGLATVRGLALAAAVPAVGVGTLEAMARGAADAGRQHPGRPLLVALDTKRRDLFIQAFTADGVAQHGPAVVSPVAAAERLRNGEAWTLLGDGRRLLADALPTGVEVLTDRDTPDPAAIAALAAARLAVDPHPPPPAPVYLRPPEARLPGA